MVKYDPKILQRFAEILYRDAKFVVFVVTVVFAVIGLGFGLALGSALSLSFVAPENHQTGVWLVGILVAALAGSLGYVIGQAIAFWYRLRAQLTLCQKQIEYNTRLIAQSQQRQVAQEIVP